MIKYIQHQLATAFRLAFNQKEAAENIDGSALGVKFGLIVLALAVLLTRVGDIWIYPQDLLAGFIPGDMHIIDYTAGHGTVELVASFATIVVIWLLAKPLNYSHNLRNGIVANCWWALCCTLVSAPLMILISYIEYDSFFYGAILLSMVVALMILSVNVLRHSLNIGIGLGIALELVMVIVVIGITYLLLPIFGLSLV